MCGNDCTSVNITAISLEEALTKMYSYFGGRHPLTDKDFRQLLSSRNTQEQIKLFEDFTNETVVFLQETRARDGYVIEVMNTMPTEESNG